MWQKAKKLVREYFHNQMPERVKELNRGAWWDLYYGPHSAEDFGSEGLADWPGYSGAIDVLQEWASEHIQGVWVDMDCEQVLLFEPEGEEVDGEWIEPFLDNVYYFDHRATKEAVFGKLVENGL